MPLFKSPAVAPRLLDDFPCFVTLDAFGKTKKSRTALRVLLDLLLASPAGASVDLRGGAAAGILASSAPLPLHLGSSALEER